MKSLNQIIKFLTFAIIPIGIALFYTQLQIEDTTYKQAVVKSVAGIIGMIPEGLVLLTSTVLAVSVIRLSKSNVLVQELFCIETLARVNVLCLDKTGTITEGKMEVSNIISINIEKENMQEILAQMAKASEDNNSTITAIKEKFTQSKEKWKIERKIPFSSDKKWSGIEFTQRGTYIIGAPEFVLKEQSEELRNIIEKYTQDYRVLLFAKTDKEIEKQELPSNVQALGLILINDKIRENAIKTLTYFKEQGVMVKIISGDNVNTVLNIAHKTFPKPN